MKFYLGDKAGDPVMARINLRELGYRARQWDHPVKGLLKYAEAMKESGGDILKLPTKVRERYCVSLFALAMKGDSLLDWWTHMPTPDPPDGLVMTLGEEKEGIYKGYMREIEVVEHRTAPDKLLGVLREKLTENAYKPDTVLVCLVLTPAIYDLEKLSLELLHVSSSVKHVFVVFSGAALPQGDVESKQKDVTYTMVQLLPVFQQASVTLSPFLDDFTDRYEKGQESRLIDGAKLYYGTTNPKYHNSS